MEDPGPRSTTVMRTGMLVRRPAAEVFEALLDPDITTMFWFTRASGRLEPGETVRWEWEMYDVSVPVTVRTVEPPERIVIEWPGQNAPATVEFSLAAQPDGTTFVTVTESGYAGGADEIVRQVAGSTEGFTLMLAGLKAWLEHGVRLNLVADRFAGEVTSR